MCLGNFRIEFSLSRTRPKKQWIYYVKDDMPGNTTDMTIDKKVWKERKKISCLDLIHCVMEKTMPVLLLLENNEIHDVS